MITIESELRDIVKHVDRAMKGSEIVSFETSHNVKKMAILAKALRAELEAGVYEDPDVVQKYQDLIARADELAKSFFESRRKPASCTSSTSNNDMILSSLRHKEAKVTETTPEERAEQVLQIRRDVEQLKQMFSNAGVAAQEQREQLEMIFRQVEETNGQNQLVKLELAKDDGWLATIRGNKYFLTAVGLASTVMVVAPMVGDFIAKRSQKDDRDK